MWQQGLGNITSTVESERRANEWIPTFRLEYTKASISNATNFLDTTEGNTAIPGWNISESFTTMLENLVDNGSTSNLLSTTATTPHASQSFDD